MKTECAKCARKEPRHGPQNPRIFARIRSAPGQSVFAPYTPSRGPSEKGGVAGRMRLGNDSPRRLLCPQPKTGSEKCLTLSRTDRRQAPRRRGRQHLPSRLSQSRPERRRRTQIRLIRRTTLQACLIRRPKSPRRRSDRSELRLSFLSNACARFIALSKPESCWLCPQLCRIHPGRQP